MKERIGLAQILEREQHIMNSASAEAHQQLVRDLTTSLELGIESLRKEQREQHIMNSASAEAQQQLASQLTTKLDLGIESLRKELIAQHKASQAEQRFFQEQLGNLSKKVDLLFEASSANSCVKQDEQKISVEQAPKDEPAPEGIGKQDEQDISVEQVPRDEPAPESIGSPSGGSHQEEPAPESIGSPSGGSHQEEEPEADGLAKPNFSNSMLGSWFCSKEPESEADGSVEDNTPMPDSTPVPFLRTTSISALELVADLEEKPAMRKGREHNKLAEQSYISQNPDVPAVVVTSELSPWSKTGGLAMVAASYVYELAARGRRTVAVSPMYKEVPGAQNIGGMNLHLFGEDHFVRFFHIRQESEDVLARDYIFVDHNSFCKPGGLYCDDNQREYEDNLFRFALLSRAAVEVPLILSIGGQAPMGDRVIFITNDWQAGLVPMYLAHKLRKNNVYESARCMHVIHNMQHQGKYPVPRKDFAGRCHALGLDASAARDFQCGDTLNLCKGALLTCDFLITVSPTYAQEIQSPHGGFGLHDCVRDKANQGRLVGILNGIDDSWDPRTDLHIVQNYAPGNFLEGKRACKLDLLRSLNLDEDLSKPLIGFVGRLTSQKGVDMIGRVVPWLMNDEGNGVTGHARLILMGQGEHTHCEMLRWAERTYPCKVCGYVGFDPAVEHKMMAGCDLLLMPSRFEPCGLPQMYSQAYGTVPVVSATGGLCDSVDELAPGEDNLATATGFLISPITDNDIKRVLYRALEIYIQKPDVFQQLQQNGLSSDYYWPKAMDAYEQHFDLALQTPC